MRIYGDSDDLVEIEGHDKGDEHGCYDQRVVVKIGDEKGGMIVVMRYAERNACWSAEIMPWDEDVPMPWPVRVSLEPERKYSAVVEIDCPKDVPLDVTNESSKTDDVHRANRTLSDTVVAHAKRIKELTADVEAKTTALREMAKVRS